MTGRGMTVLALGLVSLLDLTGCCCRKRCSTTVAPPGSACPPITAAPRIAPPPGSSPYPGYPTYPGPAPQMPANPVPGVAAVPGSPPPPPAQRLPEGPGLQPARAYEPQPPASDPSYATPPTPAQPLPAQPQQPQQPEQPIQPNQPQPQPQTAEPPQVALNPAPAQDPASSEKRDTAVQPPLDIPGFALAKTRVATGLKPFPDGIAWLQANGHRTVLHVRAPGDDPAAQKQFEKYGLRYLTLEVTPGVLTRDAVETFNRQVTDQGNYPIFIFDKDGAMTGALWMIYFRLFEGVSEEKARLEAIRLGWKPDQDPEHKAMAAAVARYFQGQNP